MTRSIRLMPWHAVARAVSAGALALGAGTPAFAQSEACAVAVPARAAQGPASVLAANHCIRDMAEGLAPVWLPAAGVPIDDVAGVPDGHRWGFIDEQGGLRIAPRFAEVGPFSHGLAAAREGDLWGYIGVDGQWAVPPRFAQAGPFSAAGLAVVRREGRWALVERAGAVLHELDPGVRSATLAGAAPARLALEFATRHVSLDGEPIEVPPGVRLVEPFGDDGLYVAQQGERYGILERGGAWRVEPRFAAIQVWQDGGQVRRAVAHEQPGVVLLIQGDGTLLEPAFQAAGVLTPRFGVALEADEQARLFTLDGRQVLTLPVADLSERVRELGEFLVWTPERGATRVLAPATGAVVELPDGLQPRQARGPVLLLGRQSQGPAQALVTAQGVLVEAAAREPWLAQVAGADLHRGQIWLSDAAGHWINVLSAEGRPLLDARASKALAEGRWQRLGGAPDAPLALARTPECGCEEGGAGLIDAAGRLVVDPQWQALAPADPGDAAPDGGPLFVVTTAAGVGLLDARGGVRVEPDLKHVGTFHEGYAIGYGQDGLLALDREGARQPLPDVFLAEPIGAGWFRFLETALVDAQWGIYDVARQRVVRAPAYARVGERRGDYTLAAVHAEGGLRWGLLDAEGAWRLQPEFDAVEPLPDGHWQVSLPGAQGSARAGVIRADGSWLIEPREGLEIQSLGAGGWIANADGRSWLYRGEGRVLASADGERFAHREGWFALERRAQAGYVDARGQWALGPFAVDHASPFGGARRTALLVRGETAWLIDEAGRKVADLPRGQGWSWPPGADGPYRVGTADGGRRVTQYANPQGASPRLVEGVGGPGRGGRIAVQTGAGRIRLLDEAGKESATWLFDTLLPAGPEAPALAGAQARYGYLDGGGRYVVPPLYAAAQPFAGGRAVVSTPELSLLIDTAGRPLARVERQCGIRVLYGAGGVRTWPEQMPVRCARER